MDPEHSLLVTEPPHVSTSVTAEASLVTVLLLTISQRADGNASFLFTPVHLISTWCICHPQCTLNQFYDFILVATSLCFENEHLLTRDSVVFTVIYFTRVLK